MVANSEAILRTAGTAHLVFFYFFNCSEYESRLAVTGRPVNEQWAASCGPDLR